MIRRSVKYIVIIPTLVMILIGLFLAYKYNYLPHRKYSNDDFGVEQYVSASDFDSDGIDDQTDILDGVKQYFKTKPKYKSKYYSTGYPDDEYGVCTDVVAQGLLAAGYDLRELMDADIRENPDEYDIDSPDKNIDFRRVVNMNVYLRNHVLSLTNNLSEIDQWQAGDIVVWDHHVGIISDHRNREGIPFVLHHGSPFQASYEEDILSTWGEIVGHYRVS